ESLAQVAQIALIRIAAEQAGIIDAVIGQATQIKGVLGIWRTWMLLDETIGGADRSGKVIEHIVRGRRFQCRLGGIGRKWIVGLYLQIYSQSLPRAAGIQELMAGLVELLGTGAGQIIAFDILERNVFVGCLLNVFVAATACQRNRKQGVEAEQ